MSPRCCRSLLAAAARPELGPEPAEVRFVTAALFRLALEEVGGLGEHQRVRPSGPARLVPDRQLADFEPFGVYCSWEITLVSETGVELLSAGDVYYCPSGPPGHSFQVPDSATTIDYTPIAEQINFPPALLSRFDVIFAPREGEPTTLRDIHLPMAGWHNVSNALAAIAVARELDVSDEAIKAGLAGFGGVRRRFTTTGVVGGVRIVDDYGHHPVEIAAVLKAARQVAEGRVIAVVQPHRFTRLESLMEEFSTCFSDADAVFVADVYAAGEVPIEGVDKDALVEGVRRFGHRSVHALDSVAALPGVIAAEAREGDLVVLLGAGDITQWAYALPGQLEGLG